MLKQIDRVYSDNPFVDELVYYTKFLAVNCILKNKDLADNAETISSVKKSDLYITCIENRAIFELFDTIPIEILKVSTVDQTRLNDYLASKDNIPVNKRDEITKLMVEHTISNYEEENNYYRMIIGLPNYGKPGLYVPEDLQDPAYKIDYSKYIHEMSAEDISVLDSTGVLEEMLVRNPDDYYIKCIPFHIELYTARISLEFQILFIPSIENNEIAEKFQRKFELNRDFTLKTVYSTAFKFGSDYYDSFISILMIVQTMTDMIVEVQEHILNREIFDKRCIKYIFDSYGVPFYDEIPTKYQIRMMKNLNTILKYKSTSKCMIDICSLFGFDDIEVFKYYILRDRNIDPETKEYIFEYNKRTEVVSKEDVYVEKEAQIITPDTQKIYLNFPIDDFLINGNKIMIKLDEDYVPDTKYVISGNELTFTDISILQGKTSLYVDYIYIQNGGVNTSGLEKYQITIENRLVNCPIGTTSVEIPFPFQNYIEKQGVFLVAIGTLFLSDQRYSIDYTTNTLTMNTPMTETKDLNFIFLYPKDIELECKIVNVVATQTRQSGFIIPEPFDNYVASGNKFYITAGETYIDEKRYIVVNKSLTFLKGEDYISKDRTLTFHFLYNKYQPVDIITKVDVYYTTEPTQSVFNIKFPFAGYLENGNKMFVKIRDVDVSNRKYNVIGNRLEITDDSLFINAGGALTITFVYPNNAIVGNVSKSTLIQVDEDKQLEFKIPFPFKKFLERGNSMLFIINGLIINEKRYIIKDDTLTLLNVKEAPYIKDEVMFAFLYNQENSNTVVSEQIATKAQEENQKVFVIPYPFYDYNNTKNGFFVIIGSVLIPDTLYTISGDKIVFDDSVIVEEGREVVFLFIYHTVFKENSKYVSIGAETIGIGADQKIRIPVPYEDYFDDGFGVVVKVGGIVIDPTKYDIIDNELVFHFIDEVLSISNRVTFMFYYSITETREVLEENYSKNYALKFLKVPVGDNFDRYIRNDRYIMSYDTIVSRDEYWNGEQDHNEVKASILEKEFNYELSKFVSIDSVIESSRIAFDIPHFFNIFFDSSRLEDRLLVNVPYLDSTRKFKLNDIFVFLFALNFSFNDIEDDILNTTSKILSVKGFNFKADLGALKTYLAGKNYTFADLGIETFKVPRTPFLSFNQLKTIFTENKKVYQHVVSEMINAKDKYIYDIYKKIYDSLMITEYTNDYYKLPSGEVAKTYTEFLEFRDPLLASKLKTIKAVTDATQRKEDIVNTITNVVYSLDEVLSMKEYDFVYNNLPGISVDYIKKYIQKVISYFHSYTVQLLDITTILRLNDKLDNTIKVIESVALAITRQQLDYNKLLENTYLQVSINPHDRLNVLENIRLDIEWFVELLRRDKLDYLVDAIASIEVDTLKKDVFGLLNGNISKIEVQRTLSRIYNVLDLVSYSINRQSKTKVEVLDNIKVTTY